MIGQDDFRSSHPKGETHTMKKLMTLMLGAAFVFTTTAAFAQEPKKDETKKEGKKKGGKKKEGDKKEADKK
jgi:hypothetical protein